MNKKQCLTMAEVCRDHAEKGLDELKYAIRSDSGRGAESASLRHVVATMHAEAYEAAAEVADE